MDNSNPVIGGDPLSGIERAIDALGRAFTAGIAGGVPQSAFVSTAESTTSTTYADLTTTTDQVTVNIGQKGAAIIFLRSEIANNTNVAVGFVSFAMSGANTQSAQDSTSLEYQEFGANAFTGGGVPILLTGLNPGSTTFKMKYRVQTGGAGSGTGTFTNRRIGVIPL